MKSKSNTTIPIQCTAQHDSIVSFERLVISTCSCHNKCVQFVKTRIRCQLVWRVMYNLCNYYSVIAETIPG